MTTHLLKKIKQQYAVTSMPKSPAFFITIVLFSLYAANTKAQYQYHDSDLERYQIYVTPYYNYSGVKTGVRVHTSLGAMYFNENVAAHYFASCVLSEDFSNQGNSSSPCLNAHAKVWTKRTPYGYVGEWNTQILTLDCSKSYQLHVTQPYTENVHSKLNFDTSGGSPYRNWQLFYTGSADTAKLQINNCDQVYY